MKKIKFLINVTIIFAFVALLWTFITSCKNLNFYIEQVKYFSELGRIHEDSIFEYYVVPTIDYSILVFLNAIAIPGCVFIFVYCNPKIFRRSTWENLSDEWTKNKDERAARKQAKAEELKQKQIAELEQKLDELKKD